MKRPTTFNSMKMVLAIITNFVILVKSQFEKLDLVLCSTLPAKTQYLKTIKIRSTAILVFLLFFSFNIVQAQVGTKFSARLDDGKGNKYIKVQGDVKIIGNTILTPKGETLPFNKPGDNNSLDAVYLNVDADGTNVSSSSADLLINNGCKRIIFAGLYWSAMYPNETSTDGNCFNCGTAKRSDWNQVRFKVPGGNYTTITADKANPREVIFEGNNSNNFNNGVYVCFKDVTTNLQALANADGTYVVGNLRATRGIRRGGAAGGWSLVVIYESPTVSSKYISVFDGAQMTNVDSGPDQLLQVDIPISGFQTLPSPFPVKAKIGVAALDGDFSREGDGLLFVNGLVPPATLNSAFTPIFNTRNPFPTRTTPPIGPDFPKANFFNASITVDNAQVTNRNPNSTNNLGFDIDYLEIPNPSNSVIPNGATQGTYRLFTDTKGGDGYAAFLSTFAVDIIEPKITLTKEVFDYSKVTPANPNPINMGGKDVTLGAVLDYVIGFQNQGNDNATNFTITDILPINTKFNYPADIMSLPPDMVINGVTYKVTHTYNPATRTIVFTIPKEYVEISDRREQIRIRVKVVESCSEISDVCSNVVQNTALSNYSGTYNTGVFGDKSLASYTSCNIGIPQSTNFLVDVDDCKFEKSEILCGNSMQIKAANGYDSYSWSTSPTGTPVIGTQQTLTVVKEGVYYVRNTAPAPCLSITEKITVALPQGLLENPVLPYARSPYVGEITECPDSGKLLPNLFLCGATDFRDIKTGISSNGSTITWEKLVEGSCTAVANVKCANESKDCTWTPVGTGPDFRADTKGQYRLTIQHQNNCFNQFYFNVFKNELNPRVTYNDIYCNTKGKITVNDVPTGYEYSLTRNGTYTPINTFTINDAGNYTVFIKQIGVVSNPCIFEVSVTILDRKLVPENVETIVTQPTCFGDKGSIKVNTSGVRGQYYYELFKNGASVQKVGPVADADHIFEDLDAGGYSYTVTTDDGCAFTNPYVAINEAAGEIISSAAIARPLTDCTTGLIRITSSQERNYSNSFYYYINESTTFQGSNEIEVSTPGTYRIRVVGSNNCEKTITIEVPKTPKPTYTIDHTNSKCYEDPASITINLTSSTAGYVMGYSINGGTSYQTNPVFTNLSPGTYGVKVRYSVTYTIPNWPGTETVDCFYDTEQVIITGPTSSVTASAGVAELAGCGPLVDGEPTGLIRFTNVEGGVEPYEYSFDGGINWQPSNQKWVKASVLPYDLRVRDLNKCFYKIPYNVILDPKPADPEIQDNVDTIYNCDGTATATIVVNTPVSTGATYTYEYYLKKGTDDPVPNNPITSNVFTNVPSGNYKVIVKYNIQTVSTYSNLLQEDFGRGGYTTTPGISPLYCFEDETTPHPSNWPTLCGDINDYQINDGKYAVASSINTNFGGSWLVAKDHTLPAHPFGRFLCVNIGKSAGIGGILYSKPIHDVIPNQPVIISLWAENLMRAVNTGHDDPKLTIQLINNLNGVGGVETIVATTDTSNPWRVPKSEKWEFKELSLNPGAYNNLSFVIRSYSNEFHGNDVLIDDIWVRQIPRSCGNEKEVPVIVDSNAAFTAPEPDVTDLTCSNTNDGIIIITATNFNTATGFYYSIDNGANWNNSTTSPVNVVGRSAGAYKVIVKNDLAGTCSYSHEVDVKAPDGILIVQVDKTQPTCITDGSITVTTVSGGTGSYEYQLSNGSGIVKAFQSGKTFNGIEEGTYQVMVRDANGCLSPASADIVITKPTAPIASIQNTGLCFDGSNASITVTISGGTPQYRYKVKVGTGAYSSLSLPITGTSFTYPVTVAGEYSFIIVDQNNCESEPETQIISRRLTAGAIVTKTLSCAAAPASNATIEVTIDGGTAPYTYVVKNNVGTTLFTSGSVTGPKFTYDAANSGNYTFDITDSNNCTTSTNQTVNPTVPVTAKATVTDVTCFNADNGSVVLEGLTGEAPFQFNFNNGGFSTTATYSNLPGSVAGITYNYIVRDNKGCTESYTITVKQPAAITASASISTPYTCDGPATITATASNGNGAPYTFTLLRGATTVASNTTGIFGNISVAGSYTVTATDSKGCNVTTTPALIISALNPPTAMTISNSALQCPSNRVSVTIDEVKNASGTVLTGTFQYQITLPAASATAYQSSNIFTNLAPGTYTFRVKDAKNCTATTVHTINPLPVFTVSGSVVSDVKCLGDVNGSASFTVSNLGNGVAYTYRIDGGTPQSATSPLAGTTFTIAAPNLAAGLHSITVTNTGTNCPVTADVTIAAPTALLALDATSLTHVTCKANGTATINAKDGWGTYSYSVTRTAPTAGTTITQGNKLFTNLTAGNYSYKVTDLKGCEISGTFTINDKVLPTASIDPTSVYCAGGAGATLSVTPNTQTNYTYSINGSTPKANGTFSGLTPGKYIITVTDTSTGCSIPLPEQTIALPVTASTTLLADLDCDIAPASPDASIQVTINNGYPGYSYKVNKDTAAPFNGLVTTLDTGVNTFTYAATTSGTYYFEITDSKGCKTVVSRTINVKVFPTATATPTNPTCFNGTNGSITVNASLGLAPYTYAVSTTSATSGFTAMTSNILSNAGAGNYWFRVTDSKKCPSVVAATLTNPSELTATAAVTKPLTCGVGNASQAATITVTVVLPGTPYSGVNPYRYSYNGLTPVTSNTYSINTPGPVSVVVYDANGCSYTIPTSPVVDVLSPPSALAFAQANTITCDSAELDSDLTVTVTNGTAPYRFEITSTDAAVAPSPAVAIATGITTQAHTFVNLIPGTYYFKITDANNCTITGDYKIDDSVPVQVTGSPVANVSCNAGTDGSIKFTVTNTATVGTIVPVLTRGGLTITPALAVTGNVYLYSGLTAGTYIFTATNNVTKCFATSTVSISEPTAIIGLAATASKVTDCTVSPANTTIKVTATGGVSPLQYAVVRSGVTPVASDYNSTGIFVKNTTVDGLLYDAYVMDKNGNCSQNIPVSVVKDAAPTIDPVAPQCYSGNPFTITMGGNVFTGSSIQYGINGVYTTNPIKTIPGAGSYNLTVKDDNGCISPVEVYDVIDQLTISAKLDRNITCFTIADAQITLSADGGIAGDYTYEYKVGTGGTYLPVVGNVINTSSPGDYYFRVTSGECFAETTAPVKVTAKVDPEITGITQTQFIKCNGDETAAINIAIDNSKGLAPFVFNVSRYTDNTYTLLARDYVTQTSGLAAGFYRITVTDAKGCTDTRNFPINGIDPIDFELSKIDIKCTSGTYTLGSITVKDVVGGTAPYKYFISNNYGDPITPPNPYQTIASENYTFMSIINFGIYTINVVDANGCSFSRQITMTSPPEDLEVIIDTSAPNCTDGTATVTVKASPLGSNYTFGIFETNVPPFSSTFYSPNNGGDSHIFTGLTPGVLYTFVVHDGDTGCDFVNTADIAIPAASTLVPVITPHNVTCIGEDDGYVSFSITGYDTTATSIDYQVFAALSNADISGVLTHIIGDPTPVNYPALPALPAPQVGNLVPGQYYIVFTERGGSKDGCKIASEIFNIQESAIELSVTASVFKNENCNDLGIITAQAKDGTGPYEYLVNTTNITPTATTLGWQTSNTFDLAANLPTESYYVFAKDANGCIKPATAVTLTKDLEPVFALSVPDRCAGEGNFSVDVSITDTTILIPPTPSMAPYSISVNNGAFENFTGLTYTATGLNSGEQTIVIQDKNGCPVEQKITINATPEATAVVTKVLNCSVIPTAVSDAVITVSISKGTRPYTYQAYKNNAPVGAPVTLALADVSFTYPVIEAEYGTYKFLITDANDCPIETNDAIVDEIIPIDPDFNAVQPLCNGGSGTIELLATGGKGPYTFSFNGSGVFSTQTVYTVPAGTYPFIVKDDLGCEVTGSAILGQPSIVQVVAPTISPLTCGPGNIGLAATVDLSAVASGGTGTFLYSFNGSAFDTKTIYTVNDNNADQLNIPFAVQDENGCEASGTIDIFKLNPPTDFDFVPGPVITCSTLLTSVQITNVVNAVGPVTTGLTYQIISPASAVLNVTGATSGIFTGLAPGDYVFQVTDGTNCVKQLPYEIKDVIKIDIIEQSTTGITCLTATDGKASFLISGFGTGVGTYRYELDGALVVIAGVSNFSAPTIELTGLASGSHTIEVFDNETDCPKLINFDIEAPAAALTLDPLEVTPLGCTIDGAVKVTAKGGWGNYQYTLTPPVGPSVTNNNGVFGDLSDITGPFTVSVTDANGCTLTDSFTLTTPVNPVAAIDLTSDYCYDSTNQSTLVVSATLGVAPYLFSIDNGVTFLSSNTLPTPDNRYTFTDLSPGSYDIVVQDAYGCQSTVPVNTVIEPQLFATAENTKDIFCTGIIDGTIRISAIGGYGDYTYTVTKDADPTSAPIAFPVGSDTADYSVSASGSYVIVVSDARNCSFTVTNAIIMVDPTPVVYTAVPTSPSCAGTQGELSDGSILVTLDPASVDNPDYTYTIVRTVPTGFTSTQVNNGLFTELTAGTYEVTVSSSRGCSTPYTVVITDPVLVEAFAAASPFKCTGSEFNQTVVTVTATGGAGTNLVSDYTYSENGTDWKTDNTFTVDNETAQTLTYYVRDANGCIDDVTIPIAAFPKLTAPTVTFGPLIDCDNNKQEINVVINGGTSIPNGFTYNVYKDGVLENPAPIVVGNSFTYDALTAGSFYEFEIIDNNTGCSIKSDAYEVPLFNKAKLTASVFSNVDCNSNATGAIEINIDGYSGPYNYEIFRGGVTTGFTGPGNTAVNPFVLPNGLIAGTYTVVVTQTAYPSCVLTSTDVEITEPPVLDLSGLVVNVVNQNCNNAGAVLTIDASTIVGGNVGLGFTYAFVLAGGTPVYGPSNTMTFTTTQIAPFFDSYDVYVKDAKGCFDHVTVNISQDPMPTVVASVASQCTNPAGYTINVVGTGVTTALAPLEYSLDGNNFQTGTSFNVTAPGDYTVTVRDANKCTATSNTVTILQPLTLRGENSLLPVCNNPNGEITLYADGGTVTNPSSYIYTIDNWTTNQNSAVFTNLAPGTYNFKVRDIATNCEKETEVIIYAPTLVTGITLLPTAVTCNGGSNGTISVTLDASNNNPVYTYSLSGVDVLLNPVTRPTQNEPIFENLAAGTYTITVTSGRGCPETATITVIQPDLIVVNNVTVSQFVCTSGNTSNFATITVNPLTDVAGGSGTYNFFEFFKNGNAVPVQKGTSNTYTEYDFAGGSYTVNVYDNNGCVGTYTGPITIDPYIKIDKINVVKTAVTCTNPEDITVTAVDASNVAIAGIEYTLTDVSGVLTFPTNTNGIFIDVPVGQYIITGLSTATGCSVQKVHIINEPNTFLLNVVKTSDVICYGSNEGAVTINLIDTIPTPSNDAGPFDYSVSLLGAVVRSGSLASAGPLDLSGLIAGEYTVTATLTGTPYCTIYTTFVISQPNAPLAISETHTAITCVTDNNDGSISVTATGGWSGAYEYQLENSTGVVKIWSPVYDFTNLTEGNYTVRVRDAQGCIRFVNVSLANPTPIQVTASPDVNLVSCYGDTSATITVTNVTGGEGVNYSYTLNRITPTEVLSSGPQPSPVFSGLGAGTYSVTVNDAWGCSGTSAVITINEPTLVTPLLVQSGNATCLTQASLTLSATGGTGPYSYSTDTGFTTVLGTFTATTPVTFNVAPGNYEYFVKDANGCVGFVSNGINVPQLPELEIELDIPNPVINCRDDASGVINATAKGGLGNYVYTLFDGATAIQGPKADGNFTGLVAGTNYTVRVDSGDCREVTNAIIITQPNEALTINPIVNNVTCNGNDDGKIVINATGGTGQIMYAISPNMNQFFDNGTFENLKPGLYQVIAQDALGCFVPYEFEIIQPSSLNAVLISGSLLQEQCKGEKNGEFSIRVNGATAPYSVSLDVKNGPFTQGAAGQTDFDFVNLSGGAHIVYVKDSAGCLFELEVLMDAPVVIDPRIADTTYGCETNTTIVSFDSSVNLSDLDFSLDNSGVINPDGPVFKDLAPGPHTILVRHTNGCDQRTEEFIIEAFEKLTLNDITVSSKAPVNIIRVQAAGGKKAYEYSFNKEPFTSSNEYRIYETGIYEVTVRDQNGCEETINVPGKFIDFCMPNYFTPNGDGNGDGIGPDCGALAYKNLTFDIFDRYGRVVAKYRVGEKWDGKYNGSELPTGDYWYVLKLNDEKDAREFVGHFTLYR